MEKYVLPSEKYRLIAFTQDHENYAWLEDGSLGTGDNAYWKAKGGSDWCVAELTQQEVTALGQTGMQALVDAACPKVEQNNDGYRSYILDWEIFSPGEMTQTEKDYKEFEGDRWTQGCPSSVACWVWAHERMKGAA